MVRCSQQILHFSVRIDHVLLGTIDVIAELRDGCVLSLNFTTEILCLVFGSLDNTDDFLELPILFIELFLL